MELKKNTIHNKVWLSWEHHRRTSELAKAIQAELIIIDSEYNGVLRYLYSIAKSIEALMKKRTSILFVQNPSIILAFFSGLLKYVFGYMLIVDRHTNFRIDKKANYNPKFIAWEIISLLSLRMADLTIVTNSYLVRLVNKKGGKGFELADKIPLLQCKKKLQLKGRINFVFICSYADDEPYLNVFEAASKLPKDVYIYVTGNYMKINDKISSLRLPHNIILTGFLEEQNYLDLLYSCDAIMDFTNLEYCLVCGGYESMAVGKPLLTSKTDTLIQFYGGKGVCFCDNSVEDIADKLLSMIPKLDKLTIDIKTLKLQKEIDWVVQFNKLKKKLQL